MKQGKFMILIGNPLYWDKFDVNKKGVVDTANKKCCLK